MIVTVGELKKYLRLDTEDTDDDTFLETLIKASEESLRNQTGKIFDDKNKSELAKMYVLIYCADLFENRSATEKTSEKVRFVLEQIVCQISLAGYYNESD